MTSPDSMDPQPGALVRVRVHNFWTDQWGEWDGEVIAVHHPFCTVEDSEGDSYVIPLTNVSVLGRP